MEKHWYTIVDEGAIPLSAKMRAWRTIRHAKKKLDLPGEVEVKFFSEWPFDDADAAELYDLQLQKRSEPTVFHVNEPISGLYWARSPNSLWIKVSLKAKEQIRSILHECFHLSHAMQYRPARTKDEATETEKKAKAFEDQEVENLL